MFPKIFILIVISLVFVAILTLSIILLVKVSKKVTKPKKIPKYMFNNSPYAPTKDGFSGTPINKLAQPKSFYTKHYEATIKYLAGVYPTGEDSFRALDSLQLASFYNSLTFYYNCEFQYHDEDIGSLPGVLSNRWDPLPCKDTYPLPYPPQGIFFNFYTYAKYNIPYVYSNSDGSIKYLNLKNFGNCRPGLAFVTYEKGEQGVRPGPGMFWVLCRSIQRYIWHPIGFKNNKKIGDKVDNWEIIVNKPVKWNYPKGWLHGYGNNQFIEVTHFSHGPGGITSSPGWWYNGFTGTGLFLNLGRTIVMNNKIDGVFQFASELATTSKGKQFLQKYFGSSDPYMIIYNYQAYIYCDGKGGKTPSSYCAIDISPCCVSGGSDPFKGLPLASGLAQEDDFKTAVTRYQNSIGIPSNTPTYQGIKSAIDAATQGTSYILSRFSLNILGDEPMFFMGSVLGYDTIQMPFDPNSNGYFVYELIDLRLPPKYRDAVKVRDYSQMINITSKGAWNDSVLKNTWKPQFLKDTIDYLVEKSLITIRDPLDIYNEKKVQNCPELLSQQFLCPNNQPWLNVFCSKNKLSNAYKCLSMGVDDGSRCILTGENPTC